MEPKFLLDEHISPDVAAGCRDRRVNVVSVSDRGLLGADDLTVFRRAIGEGRILVTYNSGDYALLFGDMLKEFKSIPGVVFVDSRTIPVSDIGGLVKALARLADLMERGDADPTGGLFLSR